MNLTPLKFPLFALAMVALIATQPGASCVSDTSSGGETSSGNSSDHSIDTTEIPSRAAIVKEGRGPLEWTADADGDLYVQDLKTEASIVVVRIHRGESVSLVPDENRVRVDEKAVFKGDLKKDHAHRLYLLRDRRFSDSRNDSRNDARDDSRNDRDFGDLKINKKDVGPYNERGIPHAAQMMDQGMNRDMSFLVSKEGRVFIFDVEGDRVVATADIEARQKFTFSPQSDRATIDGKRVIARDFDSKHQYRVYFSR